MIWREVVKKPLHLLHLPSSHPLLPLVHFTHRKRRWTKTETEMSEYKPEKRVGIVKCMKVYESWVTFMTSVQSNSNSLHTFIFFNFYILSFVSPSFHVFPLTTWKPLSPATIPISLRIFFDELAFPVTKDTANGEWKSTEKMMLQPQVSLSLSPPTSSHTNSRVY